MSTGGCASWAHMLGFGGHFFTKIPPLHRHLPAAAPSPRRLPPRPPPPPPNTSDVDEHQVLEVVAELVYGGTGWHTTGDALLANTSAALARERRRIGKEEIATTG